MFVTEKMCSAVVVAIIASGAAMISSGVAQADMEGRQPAVVVNPDKTVSVTCTDSGYGPRDTSFNVYVFDSEDQQWNVPDVSGQPSRPIGPINHSGQGQTYCDGDQSGHMSESVTFTVP